MHHLSMSILTAVVDDGRVVVSYKLGMADGITLYSRRDGEPDFSPWPRTSPGRLSTTGRSSTRISRKSGGIVPSSFTAGRKTAF